LKVLFLADNPTMATGYGKIVKNLGFQLNKKGIEVGYIGIQYLGAPIDIDLGFKTILFPFDVFNSNRCIDRVIDYFKPDYLIHVRDNWAFFFEKYNLSEFKNKVKIVLYSPVNEYPVPIKFLQCVNQGHFQLVTTKKAMEYFKKNGIDNVDYLYHGVDLDTYKRFSHVKKEDFGFTGEIVIGFIGENTERKDIPKLIYAVSELSKKYDLNLYLHTNPEGKIVLEPFQILTYIHYYKISQITIFPRIEGLWGFDDKKLAEVINCFDIYCSPSKAEGFDIPCIEAQACGIPVIASKIPAHEEIMGDNYVKVETDVEFTKWGGIRNPVKVKDLIEKLELLIEDEKLRKEYSEKGIENAKKYTWGASAEKLIKILEKI